MARPNVGAQVEDDAAHPWLMQCGVDCLGVLLSLGICCTKRRQDRGEETTLNVGGGHFANIGCVEDSRGEGDNLRMRPAGAQSCLVEDLCGVLPCRRAFNQRGIALSVRLPFLGVSMDPGIKDLQNFFAELHLGTTLSTI